MDLDPEIVALSAPQATAQLGLEAAEHIVEATRVTVSSGRSGEPGQGAPAA
jgi:hypothetical protein